MELVSLCRPYWTMDCRVQQYVTCLPVASACGDKWHHPSKVFGTARRWGLAHPKRGSGRESETGHCHRAKKGVVVTVKVGFGGSGVWHFTKLCSC
jgi:hypothetical protein